MEKRERKERKRKLEYLKKCTKKGEPQNLIHPHMGCAVHTHPACLWCTVYTQTETHMHSVTHNHTERSKMIYLYFVQRECQLG